MTSITRNGITLGEVVAAVKPARFLDGASQFNPAVDYTRRT